jgi:hypothetical protein
MLMGTRLGSLGAQQPNWKVATHPQWSIIASAKAGIPSATSVSDAALLGNDLVAIAYAMPREVRIYRRGGALVRRTAIDGGAQAKSVTIELVASGDSVGVHDPATSSTQWYDKTGVPTGTMQKGDQWSQSRRLIFVSRTMSRVEDAPAVACVRQLALHYPDTTVRVALQDGSLFWSAPLAGHLFAVASADGRPIAQSELPVGFTPLRLTETGILGVSASDSVDRVEFFPLARPPQRPVPHTACASPVPPVAPTAAATRSALFRALMAAERVKDRAGHYVSTADSLGLAASPVADVAVVRTSRRGWVGAAFAKGSSYACVAGIGDATPPGWVDGILYCSM